MTATRRSSFRSLAFVTALMMLFALALPYVEPAQAQTPDNACDLDVEPETDSNETTESHTLVATITNIGTGTCDDPGGTYEVDFEFESGPTVRILSEDGSTTNRTESTDNSPTDPDATCTITEGVDDPGTTQINEGTSCFIVFTSDSTGTNIVRGWVDDDKDDATFDADPTEGRDENTQEGQRTEPDDTDVVSKTWFGVVAADATLDCEPETATNPSTGTGSSETYTCRLFRDLDDTFTFTSGDTPISGVSIDGENLGGANDPDTTGQTQDPGVPPNNSTADYECGTTDANGQTTCTISPIEAETGTADICFWADTDNDNVYNPGGATDPNDPASQNDGQECDEEGQAEVDQDITDVVTKTWAARGVAANIDCEPENDQNVIGTSHTVTCTVTDEFGDPVQGAFVDFEVTGKNFAVADNRTTDASGQVSFTYTDDGTAPSPEGERDQITGCIDPDTGAGCAGTPVDADTVNKFWFTTIPEAAAVHLDMVVTQTTPGTEDCETGTAAEDTAQNNVEEDHEICVTVQDAQGTDIPGESVTLTIDGPGFFFEDVDNDDQFDEGEENLGKTITVTTDEDGEALADMHSEQSGTSTITATADGASDTGTKVWNVPVGAARNIDCEPETAQNDPGTSHVVTCTVTDAEGNPVPNVLVTWSESGPGRFESRQNQTDANGQAEAVVTTTQDEQGTQTITGTIEDASAGTAVTDVDLVTPGVQGQETECDQPEDQPTTGDPAGNCADSVTKTWEVVTETPPDTTPPDERDPSEFRALCDPETDPPAVQRFNIAGRDGQMIIGTNGDDLLDGTNGDDMICGLDGHDSIKGFAGDDFILGQRGQDTAGGGSGNDDIRTGTGHDTLRGGAGNDQLRAGHHNDEIAGGRGRDDLRGGRRHDTLNGGRGSDVMRASRGNDVLRDLNGRGNLFNAGPGSDTCIGRANRSNVYRRCNTLRQI